MNYSSRRQAVLEVLKSTKEHPGADVIFERCRKISPTISLGTVYRNLQQLEERGEIVRVASVNGKERYDGDTSPHMHAICPLCGRVDDYRASAALEDGLQNEIADKGFDAYALNFYKTCESCKNND